MNQSDAENMQSYPSPNVVAADSGGPFYSEPSSQQQGGISNPDELQLAAQLSRGLAGSMMNSSVGGGGPDGQEQNRQSSINHQYESNNQPHSADLRSPNSSMDHLGAQYEPTDGSMSTGKRTKVSRACDECRRKKIRCDAAGMVDGTNATVENKPCSSCSRVGATCMFSRMPMKRGPSKGYIKELADRLHNLEAATMHGELPAPQYQPQHDASPSQQRRGPNEFSPPSHPDSMTRKRTFSSMSGDCSSPFQSQRVHNSWTPQEPSRHLSNLSPSFPASQPAPTAHMFREPSYSPNGLQPAPQWSNPPEAIPGQSSVFESMVQVDHGSQEFVADWENNVIDGYYNLIHPTYPILSQSKANLSYMIDGCPVPLKEAFYEALHAAVRSFPVQHTGTLKLHSTKKVIQLIVAHHLENASVRSTLTNLVYLQTMLLMAIVAGNRGPASAERPGASVQSVWLSSAVGLAYTMRLHIFRTSPDKQLDDSADSEDKLARRVWWSLVIMDRWHASSSSTPLLIPESSVILYPTDQAVLGDETFNLARLSIILGHFSAIELDLDDLPTSSLPPVSILRTLMRGELERCRETFPISLQNSANIQLSCWVLQIQMLLRLPDSDPSEVLAPAMSIVENLAHNSGVVTPLTHYATTLAALTLIELKKYETTQEKAERGLDILSLEGRPAPSGWDIAIRDIILKNKRLSPGGAGSLGASAGHALLAVQGLQHLADLATASKQGKTDSTSGENRIEGERVAANFAKRRLKAIIKDGYLTHLSG